jgi:3-oxoacyl-[acyl-carrier protein] reductase
MSYNGFDISGKVCLITGGTSGLGKAISMGFARAGAKIVAGSTSAAKVDAIRNELGGDHDAVQIDVADENSVGAAVDHTVKKYGRLDAVVNAAGVIQRKPSLDVSVEEFERIVKTNLTGSFIVAKAAARVMKDQTPGPHGHRGSIVFIASLNSYISLSEVLAYASSKSGVLGLIRGLTNEWARFGIRVNGIAPGLVDTKMTKVTTSNPKRLEGAIERIPAKRLGTPADMAGAALFLASPLSSYIVGQTLVVDGGLIL